MKVWGVRNFYSHLERVSEEGSELSTSYFVLVAASALLATGGLLANSVVVIIGAMCIAPFLGPSRAVSVGAVYRKWHTVGKGLLKQIFGLVVVGSTLAFVMTVAFTQFFPDVIVTPEIMARTLPTLTDVYLAMFVAVVSGVIASFSLVGGLKLISDPYQERPRVRAIHYPRLFDATIGVEIAISLIPPASVMGIGLALSRFDILLRSVCLLLVNVWGLNIGSFVVLSVWRVEPHPLNLEKKIRQITEKTINAVVKADKTLIGIVLHGYTTADVYIRLYAFGIHNHEKQLSAQISRKIETETGVSNIVRIIVYPVRMHTSQRGLTKSVMEVQIPP